MRIPNANVDIWQLAAADLLRGFASRINQTLFKQRDPLTRLELSTFFLFSRWHAEAKCFLRFSFWGGILKVSFCNERANSKLRTWYFVQAKRSFHFITLGKNWKCFLIKKSHVLTAWAHLLQFWRTHAESSSKMELVMETFCLDWKLRADVPRFSLVPHEICVFGQKPSVFIFSKFSMRSQGAGRLRP